VRGYHDDGRGVGAQGRLELPLQVLRGLDVDRAAAEAARQVGDAEPGRSSPCTEYCDEQITRIHCDATGVPRSYVNMMFLDIPEGRYFVAGKPSGHSVVSGAIRLGRDLETRQRILRELSQMWTRLTGQPEEELLITLWESPAENAMEGGAIFPGIGQE
jgi:Putative oxalocrotonate tautomerase enzyme